MIWTDKWSQGRLCKQLSRRIGAHKGEWNALRQKGERASDPLTTARCTARVAHAFRAPADPEAASRATLGDMLSSRHDSERTVPR
jgi:hypothetical protein